MKNLRIKFFTITIFLCLACGSPDQQNVDREAIKKEMAQREIRHILPAEIIEAAYQQGERMAKQAQEIVLSTYRENTDAMDFPQFVSAKAQTKIDSLAEAQNAEIHWIFAEQDLAQTKLSDFERQLWEAYLYNMENKLPLDDNVQKIDDESFLYTRPLIMSPELRKKLPGTEATQDNSFLGMWSVKLAKKDIIRDM